MTDRITTEAASLRGWRKSSYSNSEGGSCLEVGDGHPDCVPVRDSKSPYGPMLLIPAPGWASFVSAVKAGGFPAHR